MNVVFSCTREVQAVGCPWREKGISKHSRVIGMTITVYADGRSTPSTSGLFILRGWCPDARRGGQRRTQRNGRYQERKGNHDQRSTHHTLQHRRGGRSGLHS